MLVLTRAIDEGLSIDNGKITVRIVETSGQQVKLGIDAPAQVNIVRQEIQQPQKKLKKYQVRSYNYAQHGK